MKIKITCKNPEFDEYWSNWDPYAPIGMHIGMCQFSPSRYIKVDLKDFIKMKKNKIAYIISKKTKK